MTDITDRREADDGMDEPILLDTDVRITLALVLVTVCALMGVTGAAVLMWGLFTHEAPAVDMMVALILTSVCLIVAMMTVLTMPSWSDCPYWPDGLAPWRDGTRRTDDGTATPPTVHAKDSMPRPTWVFRDGARLATLEATPDGQGARLSIMPCMDADEPPSPVRLDRDELGRLHTVIGRLLETDGPGNPASFVGCTESC